MADSPVTDILVLVTRVMLPKAEVPTKLLRERFDLPVTEVSVYSAEVNWKPVRVELASANTVIVPKAEVPTKPLRKRFDWSVTESVPKADVA